MTKPMIYNHGEGARPRFTIEFQVPRADFYPVASELLQQWVDDLNELERLRDAVYANGFPFDNYDHPDPPCSYCDRHHSEGRHDADCVWLAEHTRRNTFFDIPQEQA